MFQIDKGKKASKQAFVCETCEGGRNTSIGIKANTLNG